MLPENKITLYPIVNATTLLAHPKRRALIERIKKNCGLDPRYIPLCYSALLDQFVELVQALPFQVRGMPGGLMDYGLERADLALQLYRDDAAEAFDPLYAYAVFSAALLQDIGKVITQQQVMISDKQGEFIAQWLPFEGALLGRGDFYKLRFYGNQWISLAKTVAPVLAQQVMPKIAFLWLAQDKRLLQMWLASLIDDAANSGVIHHWCQLANRRLQAQSKKDRLPVLTLAAISPKQTAIGEAFLAWLMQGLQAGSIAINQPNAMVHMLTSGGIFLECPRIFQYFCDGYIERVDWLVVCTQFIALGLTTTLVGTLRFEKYYFKYRTVGTDKKTSRPTATQASYHFLQQNPQRSAYKITAPSKAQQQTIVREGLIIPEVNVACIYENVLVPAVSTMDIQPVEPPASRQLRAEKSLAMMVEQANQANQALKQAKSS